MSYNPDVLEKEGKKVVLLGNEAIARGALEAGLALSANYPGTPSSEVGVTLSSIAKKRGLYFEWSTNEKVAYEVCAGASYSGVRTMTAMKHFGLNVAADSFFPVIFTGVKGGMVLLVADDPFGHSSAQSEQDTRFYYKMAKVPCLEPSNAQEAKDITKLAFDISEEYNVPIVVRTTTMVSHSTGIVKLGKLRKPKTRGKFVKDPMTYNNIRPNLQRLHRNLIKKMDDIEKKYGNKLNKIEGSGTIGIIASGVSYQYVKEMGALLGIKIAKLTLTNPISTSFVSRFLKGLRKCIVVEELEPVIEDFVWKVAKDVNPNVEIHGKDLLPKVGEYTPEMVHDAIAPFVKIKKNDFREHARLLKKLKLPIRKPVFCQGCPHRSTFYAVKQVMGPNNVWAGDVGCYVLGMMEPFNMTDFMISMGASLGVAHGIKKVSKQKAVVFIGDSTFFHNGMPGLVNMKVHDTHPLVMILDNSITAMTGHQPHPGCNFNGMGEKRTPIKIEDVVKSYGIKNVRVVNAFDQKTLQATIKEFAAKDELSVIISRATCRLLMRRMVRSKGGKLPTYEIVPGKEKGCLHLVKDIACPAIVKKGNKVTIREDLCWGCSLCAQIAKPGHVRPKVKKK
jgi:indolepyruvate ferredoxin oxidoreductase alpha subunit